MKGRLIFFLFSILITANIFSQTRSDIEQKIQRDVDPETGEITIANSYLDNIQFSKWIDKGKVVYNLSLYIQKDTVVTAPKGVVVFFDDGRKLERANERIDWKKDGSEYSAFIELSKKDIKLFSTTKIVKFRLWQFESEIQSSFAGEFVQIINASIKIEK